MPRLQAPALPAEDGGLSLERPNRHLPPSLRQWNKMGAGVVTTSAGTWKDRWAGYGIDVLWDHQEQRLAMLYGGFQGNDATGTARIGLAYSDDGLNWTDHGSNPVFSANGTGGQPDSGSVGYFQPIWDAANDRWWTSYIGFPNAGVEQGTPSIMHATAPALSGPWTRQGVLFDPTDFPQTPEAVAVCYRPTMFQVGSTWHCFINAGPAPGNEDIWHLTAPAKEGPWTVGEQIINGSEVSGQTLVADPEVVRFGDMLVMVCASNSGLVAATCHVDDLPNFELDPDPFLTSTRWLWRPCLVTLPSGDLALYVNSRTAVGLDPMQVDLHLPASCSPAAVPAPSVKVTRTANQSIPHNTTTLVAFDAEVWDKNPSTHHDNATDNTRVYCRRAGRYRVYVHVNFVTSPTGRRWLNVLKTAAAGGTASIGADERDPVDTSNTILTVVTEADLAEGDYLEVQVFHTHGSALNLVRDASAFGFGPVLGMTWVGP